MLYIALYCTVLHCIALYCTVLHCIALYYTVLYCITLYYTVLYCIARKSYVRTILTSALLPCAFSPYNSPLYLSLISRVYIHKIKYRVKHSYSLFIPYTFHPSYTRPCTVHAIHLYVIHPCVIHPCVIHPCVIYLYDAYNPLYIVLYTYFLLPYPNPEPLI